MACDYYEVLGVRSKASISEIELAFKGRRTQYHPDRYNTADAETLAWATSKMKEVNEAYSVLSDLGKRATYDRQRNANGTSSTQQQNAGPSASPSHNDAAVEEPHILDYLSALQLSPEDASRFHIAPQLDPKKVLKALSCRGFTASSPPQAVYLHIDDTLFRGGDDGLIISDECMSFKSIFKPSNDLYYRRFKLRQFIAEGKRLFQANGNECLTFSMVSAEAVRILAWGLNRYLSDFIKWREAMAYGGDAESQNYMSLASGHDTPEGLNWLQKAATGGHAIAQHNLGMYYMHKDAKTAFNWFTLAAKQGNQFSQQMLRADQFKTFQ